jgi:hypothetical protein
LRRPDLAQYERPPQDAVVPGRAKERQSTRAEECEPSPTLSPTDPVPRGLLTPDRGLLNVQRNEKRMCACVFWERKRPKDAAIDIDRDRDRKIQDLTKQDLQFAPHTTTHTEGAERLKPHELRIELAIQTMVEEH